MGDDSSVSIPLLHRLRSHSLPEILYKTGQEVLTKIFRPAEVTKDLYERTNFLPFYFSRGDRLQFEDASFSFIFSEHFFEHLFVDEALSLFAECYRILEPAGVMRVSVPDADLRSYERPEPVGYPSKGLSFTHPGKHKTRWSVYSLALMLETAGFRVVPLTYCDKAGNFVSRHPREIRGCYPSSVDEEACLCFDYISRPRSLIVDGVKTNDDTPMQFPLNNQRSGIKRDNRD